MVFKKISVLVVERAKMIKLRKIMLHLSFFLLLFCAALILFMEIDPAFGGNPTTEQKETYQQLSNYVDGKFINEDPTELVINSSDASSMDEYSASEAKDRNPTGPIPVSAIDWNKINS